MDAVTDSPFDPEPTPLGRSLATSLLGATAFGAAAGLGHGPRALALGAVAAPVLFLGAALLATPPLYLAAMVGELNRSADVIVRRTVTELEQTGILLLGFAVPAAFFSVTMHTASASWLLNATCVVIGFAAIRALSRTLLGDATLRATLSTLAWNLLAFALFLRLFSRVTSTVVGHQTP